MTRAILGASVEGIPAADRHTYLWDDKLPRSGVKVTPTGKRVYITQYRVGGRKGRTRRITIGQHGVKTEHQARKEAKILLGEAQAGNDPASQRDKVRDAGTFGNSIDRFLSEYVEGKLKEKTATEYRRVIKLHLPSPLRNRLLTDINRADISRLHYEMKQHQAVATPSAAGSPSTHFKSSGARPTVRRPGQLDLFD